jgi:hypothetical protein
MLRPIWPSSDEKYFWWGNCCILLLLFMQVPSMRLCARNVCEFSIRINVCEILYVSCDYLFVYLLELVRCVLPCCVFFSSCLVPGCFAELSQSHIANDGQSVCLFWCRAPDISSCLKVSVLSMWGALYDERRGLSFLNSSLALQCRIPYLTREGFKSHAAVLRI